ncbi:hypothetical protein [uncultured Mediterranean phage uvMED]|jgi:hypothetical protein|nr:hypothetical protein [uncultured Mediterranean phage uvMED]
MSKTFRSDEHGDLQVPDNFAELSEADQQKVLQQAIKIKNTNVAPMSPLRIGMGVIDEGMQGLTFGSSDEIGAGLIEFANIPKTIFTDQEFGDAFNRRVDKKRKDYADFQQQYPKTAIASNVVGSVVPVAASLLLAPFTGGTSTAATTTATGVRLGNIAKKSKDVLDSSKLLAGNVTKPGMTLGQRTYEGTKLGTAQGLLSGVGYNESDSDSIVGTIADKASSGVLGGATGAVLGSAIPPVIAGTKKFVVDPIAKGLNKIASTSPNFTKQEMKAIQDIGNAFSRDEIDANQVIKKIEENISADKLEGITPVEILADYGGDAVKRKLRGLNIIAPGAGIKETLTNRGTGSVEGKATDMIEGNQSNIQSTRIGQSLEGVSKDTIKTKGINLEDGIDEIETAIQTSLDPLYKTAYAKNPAVSNLEVYKYLNQPILQRAYTQAKKDYQEKLSAKKIDGVEIPEFKNLFIKEDGEIIGVTKELPLEFLDLVKRAADSKTFNLKTSSVGSERITGSVAGNRQKIANNFRELLKESLNGDEYITATNNASDRFSLINAYELAPKLQKASVKLGPFKTAFNNLKNEAERDAFRLGVFKELTDQINQIGDNIDLTKKLLNSPNLRNKIDVLFEGNEEAKKVFLQRLIRENKITETNQLVLGGSNTAEKQIDARDRLTAFTDFIVGLRDPGSSAGLRGQEATVSRFRNAIFDPEGKQQQAFIDSLMEQNPQRQKQIFEAMTEAQRAEYINNLLQNTANRGLTRSFVPQGTINLNELLD